MKARVTLVLAGVLAALAASVAGARVQADSILWVANPSDFTGATLILSVESSQPFVHLFLYPNGNFQIGTIDQPACHVIVGPSGPGVGCDTGTTSSFRVGFRTGAAIPAGTSAKLVLDNPGGGARALTVTLKSCTAEARAAEEKLTRFKVAYENSEAAVRLVRDESTDFVNRVFRDAGFVTAILLRGNPILRVGDVYPKAIEVVAVTMANRVQAASQAFLRTVPALKKARAELDAADKALADCLSSPAKLRALAAVTECALDDVIKQVGALKAPNAPAELKRIAAEAVKGKRAVALRDLARLKTRLVAYRKATNTAVRAFAACASR